MRRHNREARQRFGEWLDITLDNRGIAGKTLAEQIGVNDSTISRIRGGASLPSMPVVSEIARVLDLDPIRLAVTASLIPADSMPGVEPYEMPKPTAQRESVRRQIAHIRGLSDTGRDRLLEAYNEIAEGNSP